MDNVKSKIKKYQKIIAQYIQELAYEYNNALGNDMTYQAIIDTQNNHFQLVRIGWHGQRFLYSVLIHLDIHPQTGNIWIQQNNTEILLDVDLGKLGVLKNHFVLGFRPVEVRSFSDLALA
jgi:XisI protein